MLRIPAYMSGTSAMYLFAGLEGVDYVTDGPVGVFNPTLNRPHYRH